MNNYTPPLYTADAAKISGSSFHSDALRRAGHMRSYRLDAQPTNTDQSVGMMKAMQESIDKVFGIASEGESS